MADSTRITSLENAAVLDPVLTRVEALLTRLERLLPAAQEAVDWSATPAFRWSRHGGRGTLQAIAHPQQMRLDDLLCVDEQKQALARNTRQFLADLPANNVLLWGPRGTGKSSLLKALLREYHSEGLRMVEVDGHELVDLPEIVALLRGRPERFVLFVDDLSFAAADHSYQRLKAMLDGSLVALPANVLIYATSNRRHLLPEYMQENVLARSVGGEIHHGEAVEEKISLSERFGLWLAFEPFDQAQYLEIVFHWLKHYRATRGGRSNIRRAALQWALERGARNGRVAWQFARDWAGRTALTQR